MRLLRFVVPAARHLSLQQPLDSGAMTTSRHCGGEPVDLDQLTASTITDDQLDSIRAELRHYRAIVTKETTSTETGSTAQAGHVDSEPPQAQ